MGRQLARLEQVRAVVLPPAVQSIDALSLELTDARVLIGSDLHAWPGIVTTGMRSFLWAAKKLKPDVICLNGDTIDGATLSRFPRAGWDYRPSLKEEVEAAQAFLADLRKASPKASHVLVRGNHCQRVENALANKVPEFEGMAGTRLDDLFPDWTVCWSFELPSTTIKHRWHNGQNATRQNALKSGAHYVTGHLHALQVTAVSDLSGTRFGIDTGTLADPYGPQFRYCEGAPRDHRSGWVLLNYQDGKLLWPEIGAVTDERAGEFCFRGRIEQVQPPSLH